MIFEVTGSFGEQQGDAGRPVDETHEHGSLQVWPLELRAHCRRDGTDDVVERSRRRRRVRRMTPKLRFDQRPHRASWLSL
jgi:nucleotide-binding universal stress UspA family protein